MRRAGKVFVKILITVLVVGLICWLIYSKLTAKPPAPPQPPPPLVTVLDVKSSDVALQYEYAGRSIGSRQVEVRARVSGILLKRNYTEGQGVKEGDLLFTIDPAPFKASLAQSQAKFVEADSNWKRANELLKAKALSGREYDEARASYEGARAEVTTAKINLGYTTVNAPISGVTSKEGLSEGSLVSADTSLLTTIAQMEPLYIYFAVPDTENLMHRQDIANGKIIMPQDGKLVAEIHLGQDNNVAETGTITFTDSIIDTQTGTVNSRVVIENPKGAILPGQFVRVVVKGLTKKNVITVPDAAVLQGPQGIFVYTLGAGDKAVITPVTLGEEVGTNRIIETGLKGGDRVITEGMIKVRPDSPVQIDNGEKKDAPAQGNDPNAALKKDKDN